MLDFVLVFILVFPAIVQGYSLVSHRLEGTALTAPMVFVAAGLLLAPEHFSWIDQAPHNSFFLTVAEVALVLTLFSEAARINYGAARR